MSWILVTELFAGLGIALWGRSPSDQRLYLLAAGIPIALLLNLAWLRLRRKKPTP